jgi:outer membrane protein assembly factor BamA
VNQFVPLLRENWVIAMRALVSSTDTRGDDSVPVVLLPSLGGGNSLRGYPVWRFRDRHRLLLTGEYRWTAGPFVDMALFIDAGKVAPRLSELDLKNLHTSYGVGFTLHTYRTTLTRIELARTREGMGLSFSFGANF